jgi:alkanesulfonate monooxygenase SsuD/methylene tetrahydromethanopterin reductase-like flavin-dependent oxidoreductase (luciferase family)
VWILGSSLFGAQVAALLGLPYAFASHFAPQQMMDAIKVYRESFRPSEQLAAPYVMLGYNVLPPILTRMAPSWHRQSSVLLWSFEADSRPS